MNDDMTPTDSAAQPDRLKALREYLENPDQVWEQYGKIKSPDQRSPWRELAEAEPELPGVANDGIGL